MSKKDQKVSRRSFIKIAAVTGFATYIGSKVADDVFGNLIEVTKQFAVNEYLESKRIELIRKLFFNFEFANIALASEGVPEGKLTYSNEELAYSAIRGYFGDPLKIIQEEYVPDFTISNSLISLGGSATNLYARDILGSLSNPRFRYKPVNFDHFIEFPFSMMDLDSPGVNRIQDGNAHTSVKRRVVIDKSKNIYKPRINNDRVLQEDYLIVTRIPTGINQHTLLLSGLHGPSIRGIADLLYKIDGNDLAKLEKAYNATSHHGFQAVFRCDHLVISDEHNGRGTTTPTRIKLIDDMVHSLKYSVA